MLYFSTDSSAFYNVMVCPTMALDLLDKHSIIIRLHIFILFYFIVYKPKKITKNYSSLHILNQVFDIDEKGIRKGEELRR